MGFIFYDYNRIWEAFNGTTIEVLELDNELDKSSTILEINNNIIFSPSTGIVEKIDSKNTEIILKSYDGLKVFIYIDEQIDDNFIERAVEEGDYILKGQPLMYISDKAKNQKLNSIRVVYEDSDTINDLIKLNEAREMNKEFLLKYITNIALQ